MVAVIATYIGVLVLTNEPELVDPDSVSVGELKALIPVDALPPGYKLRAENGGKTPWGMPGDPWQAKLAERLFENEAGSRIAVRIVVTGTPNKGPVSSYDALCSKAWPDSDCDPQFNPNRYVPVAPIPNAGVAVGMSVRECHAELCGVQRPPPKTRNATFARAGVVVTVSTQAADDASLPDVAALIQGLDARVNKLATSHGVDLAHLTPSRR